MTLDDDTLEDMYRRLDPFQPLEPGSKFYEPLYGQAALNLDDPVALVANEIRFSGGESLRLFSGYRGSGKTTELKRLKQRLEAAGFVVLYANAPDYISLSEPIEIGELLLAIAGAFGETVLEAVGHDALKEGWWDRIRRVLDTEIAATGGSLKLGEKPASLDLKFELKSPTAFKRDVQQALSRQLQAVKANADKFFEEGVQAIRRKRGDQTKVVLLFDSLEQLRGALSEEAALMESVERIFTTHWTLLRFPYVHAVFTVPPSLSITNRTPVKTTVLSTVHLWDNDVARTHCEPAWAAFRSVVRRRLGDDELKALLGAQWPALVDRLIDACGGHLRDLLRLLRDVVIRHATGTATDPAAVVDHAISVLRRDFLPIAANDATWLAKIATDRKTGLPDLEPATVNRFTRFIDNGRVLYFLNGDAWYDVHPLIRDEVETTSAAATA